MSILIKGLKMPKGDEALVIFINSNGTIDEPNWQWDYTLIKGAKAIELSDHGDLIDRDKLMKHGVYMPMDGGNLPVVYMSYVKGAEAVIPAEKSEE